MPDLKHWLAKRKKKKELEKRREAAAEKKAEETGISIEAPVDDPVSDKQLKEAKKRRKKFSKKVRTSEGGDNLKAEEGGVYHLKGYNKQRPRKGKRRNVKKDKSAEYVVHGSKPGTKTITTATPVYNTTEFQSSNSGTLKNDKYATDWDEKTKEEMKSAGLKGSKGFDVDEPGIDRYTYKDVEVAKEETSAQKKARKAGDVSLKKPDTLIKRKAKVVRKRGYKKPTKITSKKVEEDFVSKDYRGGLNPQKNSRKMVKDRDKKGGYTKTITKVRKGGDKIIEKRKTKIKREKINGQYRQHKQLPLWRRKMKAKKRKKELENR